MTLTTGNGRWPWLQWTLAAAGVVVAVVIVLSLGHPHPHAFDRVLFARQPRTIQVHMLAALAALMIGVAQMSRPKGDATHRALGWIWVILMGTVAASSLAIRVLNHGRFSPIHGLSAYSLIALPIGVIAARRGRIAQHRGYMTGLFCFALLVAGAFTFVPGRLMWKLFLG